MTAQRSVSILALCFFASGSAFGQNDFADYRRAFQERSAAVLGKEVLGTWDTASVYLSVNMVAATFNEALTAAGLRASGNLPSHDLANLPKAPFDINIRCPDPCPDCKQGWPPARVACKIATAPCRIAFAAAIGPCYLAQSITGGHAAGEIKMDRVTVSAALSTTRVTPVLSADLSRISINGVLNFAGNVSGDARLSMTGDARLLFMCYTTVIPLGAHSVIAHPRDPLSASIAVQQNDGAWQALIKPEEINVELGFDVSPLFATSFGIMRAGVTCPFASIATGAISFIAAAGGAYDQLFGIPWSIPFTPNALAVPLADVTIHDVHGNPRTVMLRQTPLSLGTVAKGAP